jgi:LAGLIDADG DNA endonuclease family
LKRQNKEIICLILLGILYFIYNDLDQNIKIYHSILPPILSTISKETLHIITGNMLGEGSIQYKNISIKGKPKGNARYSMTMDAYSLKYLNDLYEKVYSQFSLSGLHPYPNIMLPQHSGKIITQYNFSTRSLPLFTELHSIWYSWNQDVNKFTKSYLLTSMKCFH